MFDNEKDINDKCRNLITLVKLKKASNTMSLDCEWRINFTKGAITPKKDFVHVIQVGFLLKSGKDEEYQAYIFQLRKLNKLPDEMKKLFSDEEMKFVGRNIKNDFKRIALRFSLDEKDLGVKNILDLGGYAFERGVVDGKNASLADIVKAGLKERLSKSKRICDWSVAELDADQKMYAALDVIKGLQVFFKLQTKRVLIARLKPREAVPGTECEIFMKSNSQQRVGSGKIVEESACTELHEGSWKFKKLIAKKRAGTRVVEIDKKNISALSLTVPLIKRISSHEESRTKDISFSDLFNEIGKDCITILLPLDCIGPMREQEIGDNNNDDDNAADTNQMVTRGKAAAAAAAAAAVAAAASIGDDLESNDQPDASMSSNSSTVEAREVLSNMDYADFMKNRLDLLQSVETMSEKSCRELLQFSWKDLGKPPDEIYDWFSTVLADIWHLQDRAKVSMHHSSKKAYYVALTRAFFIWDEEDLNEVTKVLREVEHLSDEEIEKKMFFGIDYFRLRVRRRVPPASILYWRVEAVYAIYGNVLDEKTKQPLFNKAAWAKAKNVLIEIEAGNASDPPGVSFYSNKLENGEAVKDKNGLNILVCSRGTNSTENGKFFFHLFLFPYFFKHNLTFCYFAHASLQYIKYITQYLTIIKLG